MPNEQALPDPVHRLVLTTLGRAALECVSPDGERTPLLGPGKPLSLLVYLACSPGKRASRDHLIDILWADQNVEAARHSVRQAVWMLRRRLGDTALGGDSGDVTLTAEVETDRDAFLSAVAETRFERAVELYGGDFLPQFAAPGSAEFEQWADLERDRLRRLYLRAADAVTHDRLAHGRLRKAKDLAMRARAANPQHETAWRLVLETLIAAGDRIGAEMEADALTRILADAHRPPEPATEALLSLARSATPISTNEGSTQTLTAELVGREREFAAALSAWEEVRRGVGRRLRIVGAPGLGKTRLESDLEQRLRAMGARVVVVRANPGEKTLPYSLASDLAAALAALPGAAAVSPASAGALIALNPALSSRYDVPPDRSTELEALRRRELALGDLLHAVSDEQPVAVLIDDLHWADTESRQIIGALSSHAHAHRVLLVCSTRPEPDLPNADAETITLAPLTRDGVASLVASLGELPTEPWAEGFALALHVGARGTPLLILETLRLLADREILQLRDGSWRCADSAALETILAKGGALSRRIEDLGRNERWLLVLLGTAGSPIGAEALALATGRDIASVRNDLFLLDVRGLAAHVATEWLPAHDEIGERALELASPEARRSAHQTIGRHLASLSRDDPTTLLRAARHLAAAADEAEFTRVFIRRVQLQRRLGDRRSARVLAAEMLGTEPQAIDVRRLMRRLPWSVRFGLAPRRVQLEAAAGLLLVAAGGAAGLAMGGRSPAVPDMELVLLRRVGQDSSQLTRVPIQIADWRRGDPLHVAEPSRIQRETLPMSGSEIAPSPDGAGWVMNQVVPGPGESELFLVRNDGSSTRLTNSPQDDLNGAWAPDGRSIVFQTVRWSPQRRFALAVVDVATTAVRPLVRNDDSNQAPFWSPDGTRIAFERVSYSSSPDEVCWVAVDGREGRCIPVVGFDVGGVLGWYSEREVFVKGADANDRVVLLRVDVTTGSVIVVERGWMGGRPSPDGRWIACLCRRTGIAEPVWLVYPTEHPEQSRQVTYGAESGAGFELMWQPPKQERQYLDRLRIIAPTEIPLDAAQRLRVDGTDAQGEEAAVWALRWEVSDSSILTIDSTGVARPRRTGVVTIRASAGGWRRDSVTVAVIPARSATIFTEDWRRKLTDRWVPFGIPRPLVLTDGRGQPAFWNRGDSSWSSGAYSLRSLDPRRGLGLEALISTPISAMQWQYLSVALDAALEDSVLAHWDRATGSLPGASMGRRHICGITYPAGDGVRNLGRMGGVEARVDPALRLGQWHRLRLQVFPDGRCGVALDGHPLGRDESPAVLDRLYRVVLQGKSVRTKILVGRLEVWEGVRGDVDWEALNDSTKVTKASGERMSSSSH